MAPGLTVYQDISTFYADVREHLEGHEAENGLLLGLISRLAQAEPEAEPPFVARYHDGAETLGVAYRTPLNLIISRGTSRAAEPLIQALQERGLDVPGIVGPKDDVEPLAAAWAQTSGRAPSHAIEQMLYDLRHIDWPTGVPGGLRVMTQDDVELVTRWLLGFRQDAVPHEPLTEEEARQNAFWRPSQGMTYLWEVEGVSVALAALARPTRRGIAVNAVYTPPEHRRHGYASALVAAVSAEGLSRGKEFCVLYTDLSNPTSNAIYQAIGYRPVSRAKNVRFN
jgi:ribosomal protein S18 acetylase RimI-like enzyme